MPARVEPRSLDDQTARANKWASARGDQIGQSDEENTGTQALHYGRYQAAEAAFEGKNACVEDL
jgi:hypothetical protein